jgi:hypothetical protein
VDVAKFTLASRFRALVAEAGRKVGGRTMERYFVRFHLSYIHDTITTAAHR